MEGVSSWFQVRETKKRQIRVFVGSWVGGRQVLAQPHLGQDKLRKKKFRGHTLDFWGHAKGHGPRPILTG